MKIRKFILVLFSLLFVFLIWFSYKVGILKSVEIRQEKAGPLMLVYKEHVGPYHEIIDAISAVETWAKENKISCRKTFGEYLDDPQVVEHDRLRSLGGCVVDLTIETLPADLKFKSVPEKNYVVGLFYGAPMIGPYKVYPKASEYFSAHGLKQSSSVIEIYEMMNEKELLTKYLFEILP